MNLDDLELVIYPAEILEKKTEPVDISNPGFDPKELKAKMAEIMLASGGIGLSANQVGLDAQVFIMGDTTANTKICINPIVLQHTAEKTLDHEGCLSFPKMFVKVQRPKEILVEFYDENMEQVTTKITGYTARVFLHEFDHLQGITMKDRVGKLKWQRAEEKKNKVAKRKAKA
jgi:peptide deformylase